MKATNLFLISALGNIYFRKSKQLDKVKLHWIINKKQQIINQLSDKFREHNKTFDSPIRKKVYFTVIIT
jgi:hypothetical protein